MQNKTFLISTILILLGAMFISTFIIAGLKPELHKTFQLEIINVKIKK